MGSLNPNDGVDVIGHHHIPVDDHVHVVVRDGFHFGLSNDSRVGKHYLSIDRTAERALFVLGAEGDKVPAA
jgi:hypothetical protein